MSEVDVSGPIRLSRTRFRRALGPLAPSLGTLAPMVYLVTALPVVIFLTTLTPPFQAPDETNHFRRAVQILRGELVGHEIQAPGWSGGHLPKNVGQVAESFSYLIGHPDQKFSPEIMREAGSIPWNWTDREFESFANTVIYPPFFYLPTVGALAVARGLGCNVLDAYDLARQTTAVFSVLVATTAIGIAVNGRALLFVLLSLPMSIYLFASVSQDALLMACTALAMSLCSRAEGQGRPLMGWESTVVAVLLGCAIAARPPYVFLLAVLATPLVSYRQPGPGVWTRVKPWLPLAAALAIGIGWIVLGARLSQTPMRLEAGVSIPDQTKLLIEHPSSFGSALLNTVSENFGAHFHAFVGVLGWSDTPLPPAFYPLAACALALASAAAVFRGGRILTRLWGYGLLAACGLTCVAVCGALYLSWTPVGAAHVDGIQGRYFLPAATMLAVSLPALVKASPRIEAVAGEFQPAVWLTLFAMAIASDLWLPRIVFKRFFG